MFVETVRTVKTVATMIYNALYIAIGLHFSRKILGKLQGDRREHLRNTLMCLRNMPPDEIVYIYRKGHSEPLKMPASSAANYIYAQLNDLGRIPI